ncbi:MAG: ergosterol biosynthesis protein [Bacteroidota bacterium]|nr:ergosterol biosynthesis protein [Bacteroidota bacterium]
MDNILGFLSPAIIYLIVFILNAGLPGRWVTGYATKENSTEKLRYRLNGIFVLLIMVFLWFLLGYTKIMPWDWLYLHRWHALSGAFCLGIIFTLWIVLPYPPVKKSFFADLYLGRLENPQLWNGRIDAKMYLYLIGAVLLELNVLSFTMHHWMVYKENASPGIFLSAALLTYFLIDYMTFEEVHLYTYDLFAERVGFKLGWGCMVFYPFFYVIALWSTADLPNPHTSTWLLCIYALIFFCGWGLSRGANLQKYFFKKDPKKSFLGIVPEVVTDGQKVLLSNGFWGVSRHINYLGEILMATGIILCVGYPLMIAPWLYPLYYVVLLFPRQIDDDKRCALKYGEMWKAYVKKVPYRIIPYLY